DDDPRVPEPSETAPPSMTRDERGNGEESAAGQLDLCSEVDQAGQGSERSGEGAPSDRPLTGREVDEATMVEAPLPGGLVGAGRVVLGREPDWVGLNGERRLGDIRWSCVEGTCVWRWFRDSERCEDDVECWGRKMLACAVCSRTMEVRCRATRDDRCGP